MPKPNLAILYWFYKEPAITKNHLELVRKHNPGRKVYGLFGGEPSEAGVYQQELNGLLDDFWTYPGTYGADFYSKWIHGDLMLLDWYDKRGRNLDWESLAITQWDILVFDDILRQLPGLRRGQVYFSGYRILDPTLETRWAWTDPKREYHQDFDNFSKFMSETYDWHGPLQACLFIFVVLTREFFDHYLQLTDKHTGMLEYKAPTLSKAWGMDIYERDLGVDWEDWRPEEESALIADWDHSATDSFVKSELKKPNGWRIFHPNLSLW